MTGRIRLDRMLFTSTRYPADYGYIENTLGDGRRPAQRAGAARGADLPRLPDRLCLRPRHVPHDRREGWRRQGPLRAGHRPAEWRTSWTSTDVSEFDRLEIQHFFETYKDQKSGKSVEGAEWVDRAAAEEEVVNSLQRAQGASRP